MDLAAGEDSLSTSNLRLPRPRRNYMLVLWESVMHSRDANGYIIQRITDTNQKKKKKTTIGKSSNLSLRIFKRLAKVRKF